MHAPRWRRLLDGGHSWGALDVYPARYGVARYRLAIFPPGLSPGERMLLRASRSWRVWGAVLWLAMEILLVPTVGSVAALAVSTGGYLAAGVVLAAITGPHRNRVRTMSVLRMPGVDDETTVERLVTLRALLDELTHADQMLAAGEATPVQHEATVWRVYESVPA
jgi:hypothetical protein